MYQDEFEPRITPKPAIKLDCFAVPSVPEVSLIFDKPPKYKSPECKGFSPMSEKLVESKSFKDKSSASPSSNANGSYAAWREQNFSCKPPASRISDAIQLQKSQSNQNYAMRSCSPKATSTRVLKEYKGDNYTLRKNLDSSIKCQEEIRHNTTSNDSYQVIYRTQEGNAVCVKQKQNRKSDRNEAVERNVVMSAMQHSKRKNSNDTPHDRVDEAYASYPNDRRLAPHNLEQQKVQYNGLISTGPICNLNGNPNLYGRPEFQNAPHLAYQYPYMDVNPYGLPQFYGNPYPNQSADNQETVKNLLQLVNNQSEQIKSLQLQVDRLLKMQEESFKERKRCVCSNQSQQRNEQVFVESCDTINTSSCITVPQVRSTKDVHQNGPGKESGKGNLHENKSSHQAELALSEAQSKKAFMEQKVSIGVMTSFEFTVQNSPFALESENPESLESQQRSENPNVPNGVNLCETNESLRRYKNSFTRIPGAQLENIVEDSESYLSLSQQQSSNLNASHSTRDLEKQNHADISRDVEGFRSESPKLHDALPRRSNQQIPDMQKLLERISRDERKGCDTVKSPIMQKVVEECDSPHVIYADQDSRLNTQRHNLPTRTNMNNVPTNYINQRRKEEYALPPKQTNCVEDSLVLSGGDVKVNERPPPTPEPSIHVDMHEYSSDDDSEKVKRTSKVGWTFYNNVLGQVNQILQNSCIRDDQEQNQGKAMHNAEPDEAENKGMMDTVKVATLEQLRKLGISLSENPELRELNNNNKLGFDSSFYPRLDCQANMTQTTSAVNETNTSMHMKALALKYLSDEQLAELAVQRQGSKSLKHVMLSNVQGTNMSFATMRYLERYQLLPGKNNLQTDGNNSKIHTEAPARPDLNFANPKNSPALHRLPFTQTPRTSCPSKILDISTLKQQPKLL